MTVEKLDKGLGVLAEIKKQKNILDLANSKQVKMCLYDNNHQLDIDDQDNQLLKALLVKNVSKRIFELEKEFNNL
ncbi:hypothetical protein [Runella limosa]|uniref:hypothetical protein n=1 Tax=Runella limosa TaxID=370978 RepID=UPI000420C731|nr:hypothetical protein [Runella limosa]